LSSNSTSGVAALEFALTAFPLVLLILGLIYVGLHFYFQQSLDYAVQQAARQVEIGAIGSTYTQSDFIQKVLCPNFGPDCANLYLDIHPVIDYSTLTVPGVVDAPDSGLISGFQFCVGTPGQMMYAHVVYVAPSPVATLFGFTTTEPIIANAAFINENPNGAVVIPASGC
jgi:hypothetical protein